MHLLIFTEPQQGASYETLLHVAKGTEQLGFHGFFRSDHYLKMGDVDGLPGPSDAWITLAGLARETSGIRLGTLVSPATFRLPGPLAISVAGVDEMSGGRVELGFGVGWFEAEHEAYGIPYPETPVRFGRFAEQVEILDGLLRCPPGETYSFHGEHFDLADSPALPKPTQPRLPLIMGGTGKKKGAALAARYADEYNVPFSSLEDTRGIWEAVRLAATETGRELTYSAAQALCLGRTESEFAQRAAAMGREPDEIRGNSAAAGTLDEVVEKLTAFKDEGASRVYLQYMTLEDDAHLELAAELLRFFS